MKNIFLKETLEEAAEKFRSNNPGTMQGGNNTKIINAFKNGAKWQQERMYSEDDMIMFADFFHNYKELLKKEKWEILEISKEDIFKKWIEKVKKK